MDRLTDRKVNGQRGTDEKTERKKKYGDNQMEGQMDGQTKGWTVEQMNE